MNATQKAKLEANRRLALERLKKRGILSKTEAKSIESRNSTLDDHIQKPSTGSVVIEPSGPISLSEQISSNATSTSSTSFQNDKKRIRPSIRTKDYIEYDFSTMQNLNGGYINPKDKEYNEDYDEEFGNKKQKTLDEWKEEQRERKALYENAIPPEHISLAVKCVECNVNIEMDPVLNDVYKLNVCKSCAKLYPEKYSLLTKTECKDDYFLTESELADNELFHRLEKPNPHSGTFARMQLFVRCEVEAFAFKKWGGEEGLDKEWTRREEGKSKRREKKYTKEIQQMRLKTRAQEYTNKLRNKKYGKTHIHNFGEPIEGGKDEDGNNLMRRRCIDCGLETDEVII